VTKDGARRALLMGSGANRGAYYTGLGRALASADIRFALLAGVSAGGFSAAWLAADQAEDMVRCWRMACRWRVAPHPLLARGRLRTVDELIASTTFQVMDVEAARVAPVEVRVAAARVLSWPLLGPPRTELRVFSNREARDRAHFQEMVRAGGFMPFVNGLRAAVVIDGERYLDGGLVARVPLSMIPEGSFDEIWVSACSPHGEAELYPQLATWNRPERLVVLTPSERLPVGRFTMKWSLLEEAFRLGERDFARAAELAAVTSDHVVVGRRADRYRGALDRAAG